jgi:hypothetical protein
MSLGQSKQGYADTLEGLAFWLSEIGETSFGMPALTSQLLTYQKDLTDTIVNDSTIPTIFAKWEIDFGSVITMNRLFFLYALYLFSYHSPASLHNLITKIQISFDDITYTDISTFNLTLTTSGNADKKILAKDVNVSVLTNVTTQKLFFRYVGYVSFLTDSFEVSKNRFQMLLLGVTDCTVTQLI